MHTLALPDPILKVRDVVSGYGEIRVLKGVSVDIPKGRIVTLIGANGAGKSTLLKTIFGLVKAEEGSIIFDGTDITGASPNSVLRMGVSYVLQGRGNFPRMTVRENLEMGAFSRNDNKVREDVIRILDLFPMLKKMENRLAGTMSGGEQQILEMAMALMLNPKLLLIDEPSLGLAPKMAEMAFEQIVEINRRGITVLMVEQNARKALSLSDFAFVLELGRNRLMGTGEEILNNEDVRQMYLGSSRRARERWEHTEHVE
jgi:ABC-type branched-subunit amino acid transport system ATPase component